jgi:5'-nucleotidase
MILLVNDDGIDAPGLRTLYAALRAATGHAVLACAPSAERSGQSQAITLHRDLAVSDRLDDGFFGFAIDGTPADCVKLALDQLAPEPPALVVSGINDGPNAGRSIFYSGTLGAAQEAAIAGHAVLAISRVRGPGGFADAADLAARIAVRLLAGAGQPGRVVNLNVPATPASAWQPLRLARHGLGGFRESYRPAGRGSWALQGDWETQASSAEDADDAALLTAGHPVISVLRPDVNDTDARAALAAMGVADA